MIKKMAWNTFKNTGDINTFLELVEIENVEKNLLESFSNNNDKKDLYGINQDNRNNSFRK